MALDFDFRIFALVAVPCLFLMAPQDSSAQAGSICMAKQSPASRRGGVVAIRVAAAEEGKFAGRGFKRQECDAAGVRADRFRRQMCQAAILKNPQVENEFYAHFGIRPSEGCPDASARP